MITDPSMTIIVTLHDISDHYSIQTSCLEQTEFSSQTKTIILYIFRQFHTVTQLSHPSRLLVKVDYTLKILLIH